MTTLIILGIIFIMLPFLVWILRNLLRIFSKYESDGFNLGLKISWLGIPIGIVCFVMVVFV